MFIKNKIVKDYVHLKGFRCNESYLNYLDRLVKEKIDKSFTIWNGGKKTLTSELFIGIPPRER